VTALLIDAYVDWECPACGKTDRTRPIPPNSSRMHDCPKLHGLTAPMQLAGTDCQITAIERGDYLHGEEQRTGDDSKPYMALNVEHADGHNDVFMYAAVAVCRFG